MTQPLLSHFSAVIASILVTRAKVSINIIKPKIAICLGLVTFNAIRVSCGHNEKYPMENAINSSFSFGGTKIFAQAHTGQMGINNRNKGGQNRVSSDWGKMAEFLRESV